MQNAWAGRLAWLGHLLDVQKVAGPNPVRPTTNIYFVSLAQGEPVIKKDSRF
jgi:hypothetical protein